MVSNETTTSTEQGAAQRNTALALNGAPTTDENFVPQALTLPSLDLPLFRAAPPQDYARPAYAEQFACIGAACEDNCCKGWSVPIDRVTYEKYSSVPGLKQHIGTLVVLNTNHPTPADYARIPLTAQSECGFLNPEKLCGIQKEHGHAMLSSTCATYPRAVTTNAGIVEKALNFSCPEAARVTLLNPHLLGQGVWKTHGPRRYDAVTRRRPVPSPATQQLTNDPSRARSVLAFEPQLAVREFALLLLGDRRYPLWQRLYLLGNFAWRLQSACEASGCLSIADWCEAHPDQVLNHLHQSARRVATESARPVMDEIAFEPDQQIQLVLEMVRIRFQQPPVPLRFLECVRDFQLGLGTATARNEQEILAAYSTSYRQYYAPLMERRPYLLENYVTNLVFKNNYPFGKDAAKDVAKNSANDLPGRSPARTRSAESEHLALCVQVALAQTLLIGMAGHYRDAFDTTHIVKLMQSQAKTLEHSYQSIGQILQFIDTKQLNNPQGIARLLRTEASPSSTDPSRHQDQIPSYAEHPASRSAPALTPARAMS